jgi:hypothetical protein
MRRGKIVIGDETMAITYENTLDDVVKFHHYAIEHSPTLRRNNLINHLVWTFSPLVGGIAIPLVQRTPISTTVFIMVVIGGMISLPIFALYPRYARQYREKQIRKLYSEGDNKSLIGTHTISIEPTGIRVRTDVSESSTQWQSIERICMTDDTTYIFVGAVNAYVIPKHTVIEGNYEECIKEIQQQWEQHKNAVTP